jgi:hypothetical protein
MNDHRPLTNKLNSSPAFLNIAKNADRTFRIAFTIWAIGALLTIAACAGGVYVVWHFISKFW